MPTKLNRAGNQQEYVPAGNGDASGEYGYNSGENKGGNKNFKVFKKPGTDEIENKVEENKVEINEKETIKYHHQNKEFGEKLDNRVRENSTESGQKIMSKYLGKNENLKIVHGGSGRNAAGSASGFSTIHLDYEEVHVYRHELGHTFDSFFGKDMSKEGWLSNRLVATFVNSEGKNFTELLHEDINMHTYEYKGWRAYKTGIDKRDKIKEKMNPICNLYNEYGDMMFDEVAGYKGASQKYQDLIQKEKKLNEDARKDFLTNYPENKIEGWQKYQEDIKNVRNAEEKYANEQRLKGFSSVFYSMSPEVQEARKKLEESRKIFNENRESIRSKVNEKYALTPEEKKEYERLYDIKLYNKDLRKKFEGINGIMGDTLDYALVGSVRYSTNGHGTYYLKDDPGRDKQTSYSCELFANMFDCYMDKDQRKYDYVKKMFPKTAEIFEEIIKKYGEE